MNAKQTKVLNYIQDTFHHYEAKKEGWDKIKFVHISKKLNKMLSKPTKIGNFDVVVEDSMDELTFFFGDEIARIPEVCYDIVLDKLIYEAIKMNRVTAPLDNTVSYDLELGAKLNMEELAFMLAIIIKEMDKTHYCSKEDMLKMINTHLG